MGCGASSFHPAEIAGGCGCSGTQRGKRNPFRRRRAEQDPPSTKQLLDKNDVEPFTENKPRPSVSPPRLSMQLEAPNNARPSVSQPRLSVQEPHAPPSKSEMQPRQPVKEVHLQTPSGTEKLPEPAVVAECAGDVEVREVRNDDVAGERKEDAFFMMCPGSPSFRDYCVDRSSCVSSHDAVEVREGNGLNGNSKDSKDQVGSETKRGGHWGFGQKKWTKLGNVYRAQFHRSVKR